MANEETTEQVKKNVEITEQDVKNMQKEAEIPAGYIRVELSTKGKWGAPPVFHVRNFKTEDLVTLSLEETETIPLRVVEMLQDLIYEPKEECNISNFHEKEVVELILIIYRKFFGNTLKQMPWIITDADKEKIAKECGGKDTDLYKRRIRAIENGEENQYFDINLDKIKFYECPKDVTNTARIKQNIDGKEFVVEYTFPRYGDTLLLKNFMDSNPAFKEKDKRYQALEENLKFRRRMEDRWSNGENVPIERIPHYSKNDEDEYKEYQQEKVRFAARVVKALHLKTIDGVDVSNLSLDQKLKYADDPRLSHSTLEKINKIYRDVKIGPIEDFKAFDPYLQEVVDIHYTFQVLSLIPALQSLELDDSAVEFI